MDFSNYERKWGKLIRNFPLVIDPETKELIEELQLQGNDVQEFSRSVLITKLREWRDAVQKKRNETYG